jgi:DNA-binding transcriptional ArsR family regulator
LTNVWFLTKNHQIMSRPFSAESAYRAIAHPTRRRVLEILRIGERPASQLVGAFKLSRPVLSEHLQVLRSTGLVSVRRRGTSLIYRINAAPLRQVGEWINMMQQPARLTQASRE